MSEMKPKLYIIRGPSNYWKLCLEATGGRNVGIIDSAFRLNGKRQLTGLRKRPDFRAKEGSSTVGGSGFVGYVQFNSLMEAEKFLEEWYDVKWQR
jgi:hypothetical protein